MHYTPTKLTRDAMRIYNQKLILKLTQDFGPISKAELSKITQLTIPSVTDILSELEFFGIVQNIGHTSIKRGRFPALYQLNSKAMNFIGITIGSTSIKAAIINLESEIMDFQTVPLPANPIPENVLNEVVYLVNKLRKTDCTIYGIGLGMHGIVDFIKGISIYPPHLNWDCFPIGEKLSQKVNLPVLVDNDCNTLLLAERWFGEGKDTNAFITINVDYGIGAGVMIQDHLFHGVNFGGGQIGHTIVTEDGPKCSCGNYGCLEAVASEPALLTSILKKIKKGFPTKLTEITNNPDTLTIEHIYEAVELGDELAIHELQTAGRYIGIGISTMVNLFNPQKVILTGGILNAKDIVLQPLKDAVYKHSLKTNTEKLSLVPSKLGKHAEVIGAATLCINEVFNGEQSIENLFKHSNKE
ncbi:ROK family protein [Bacillaceae bacterium C204]|uniref:ROK family protein n=1 Tax=Neobacillus sp. 204 TaxID=3383351 RepID=UPI00397ADCA5